MSIITSKSAPRINDGSSETKCICIPGSAGFSDSSVEFYRNCVCFFNTRLERYNSRVFCARFLMKCTVFIGDYAIVHELLNNGDTSDAFTLGYREYLQGIYGDVVLFAESNNAASSSREALCKAVNETGESFVYERISTTTSDWLNQLQLKEVDIYSSFKQLASRLVLSLFLGYGAGSAEAERDEVLDLATTHWHGIISVPFSLRVPLAGFSSSYRKSLQARERLLEIVRRRRSLTKGRCLDVTDDHLVLFISALGPKAIASVLTSLLLCRGRVTEDEWTKLSTTTDRDDHLLDCYILEVLRLYPPFIGGRRICTKAIQIGSYQFETNSPILYLTRAAQLDPTKFRDPESFDLSRWSQHTSLECTALRELFVFGGYGSRNCIGTSLMLRLIRTIFVEFLDKFDYNVTNMDACSDYKWLPISRPRNTPVLNLKPVH